MAAYAAQGKAAVMDDIATGLRLPDFYRDSSEPACGPDTAELFFPANGGITREARDLCNACPVRAGCLQWAVDNDEPWGVWGGRSQYARNKQNRSGRRDRQPREGQRNRLDTAVKLVRTLAAAGLTTNEIAEETGLARSSVRKYKTIREAA